MAEPCGATRAPLPDNDRGWDCTGEGLVVVHRASDRLPPMVLPAELVDNDPSLGPFTGGDHLHMIMSPWPHGYGLCAVCHQRRRIQRNGTIVRHGGLEPCSGTGEPPYAAAPYPWEECETFRTGRKVGRTVYMCPDPALGEAAQENLVGMFDTPELARFAVRAMNQLVEDDPELLREVDSRATPDSQHRTQARPEGDSGTS